MKKTSLYLLLIFIIFAAAGCESAIAPEAEDLVDPESHRVTVGRQWFYGRVNDLGSMEKLTFVQRTDWLADLLAELDVNIEEK